MKKKVLFFTMMVASQLSFALQIHQLRISEISPRAINISLDTEASELYYFHSWQSHISGDTITIDAFYIEGFGSTIAYLNNNFEIQINLKKRMVYQLNVRVYYSNYRVVQHAANLQDQWTGVFSTPLSAPVFITDPMENNPLDFRYQNPNAGFISTGSRKINIAIFDDHGKIVENKQAQENIDFSHLPDGLYYFKFFYKNTSRTIQIALKK